MKKKGFYLLPIVKLLDSYKVYSIIKVDPCGEVSWNFGFSGVFHVFSVQKNHNHSTLRRHSKTATPPLRPPCVILTPPHTSLCCPSVCRPSIHFSLFSSPLSPSLHPSVGLLLHFTFFSSRFLFIYFFILFYFLFECLRFFLFVRSPSPHPPPTLPKIFDILKN